MTTTTEVTISLQSGPTEICWFEPSGHAAEPFPTVFAPLLVLTDGPHEEAIFGTRIKEAIETVRNW